MSIATSVSPPDVEDDPAPPDGVKFYEVIDGRIVERDVSNPAVWIAFSLARHLGNFADAHQLGRAVSEMLFAMNPPGKPKRQPDAAFVSYERWPKRRRVPKGASWRVVPDIAVEVISPSNKAGEIMGKVIEYFEAGVRLVWVVYPDQNLVQVFESPTQVRVLRHGDTLDGAPVLRGFELPLATLFEDDATDEE